MIRQVVIAIHGSGRNADDYYCSMYSATQHLSSHRVQETLILAPRFASVLDESFALHNGGIPMRWNAQGNWRYGGESSNGNHVSSFQVLDDMIDLIATHAEESVLVNVQRLTVIGHSAGGQFVQRWALLTRARKRHSFALRAIVVNPSSFAYLTPLRKSSVRQEWILPNASSCPRYNEWEWGLETSQASPVYVRQALAEVSVSDLTQRFASRDVVYLAGDRDICNVPGMSQQGWCYSHGLETTCMDLWEGRNRLERHMNYFESLARVNVTTHQRDLVPNVGHDHSLIFHSSVTQKYLFDQASFLAVS